MSIESQKLALSVLREAKANEGLGSDVVAELIELIDLKTRPAIQDRLGADNEEESGAGESPDALQGDDAASEAPAGPLTAEQMSELLGVLQTTFENTPKHYNTDDFRKFREAQGVTFGQITDKLKSTPALARSVYNMHERGGEPDFWKKEGDTFYFAEFCEEACEESRGTVYDKASADKLIEQGIQLKGSAEEQCTAMKCNIFTRKMRGELEQIVKLGDNIWEWLESKDILPGRARGAGRIGGFLFVCDNRHPDLHASGWGWRAFAKG